MAQALIALGSNIGDRAALLGRAVDLLSRTPQIKVLRHSSLHETQPVGGPVDQTSFLNGAVLVKTSLDPFALLRELQRIETELERSRTEHWGPRTADLDLLLFESVRLESPDLTIPHPRMSERRFVLAPAAEIAPDLLHPVTGLSVRDLFLRLNPGPIVVTTIADVQRMVGAARRSGKRIGLAPTMGALHDGHLSLVDASNRECAFTVVSIFVNPTQFGPHEDFARYPRTFDQDLALLSRRGVDIVFAPPPEEMYSPDHATTVAISSVTSRWEGPIRPGHFAGVATIVLKLFHASMPDVAFFGQKDYQQCAVIRRMTADLNLPIEVRVCPIVRDADGLALSSRNRYLTADERRRALSLSRSLSAAADLARNGRRSAEVIAREMHEMLLTAGVDIDYAAVVDGHTLEPVDEVRTGDVALVAARVGATRLIDNHVFD
jgi:pantoate--beta-alanine ligase